MPRLPLNAFLSQIVLPLLGGVLLATTGRAQHHLYTLNGNPKGDAFGYSVSSAGDVNRDKYADVIVGAPYEGKNGSLSGSALVFSGRDGRLLYSFYGDSARDFFGISVSGAGDVNRDGYADLIVGAPGDDNNGIDSGSARVLSGKDGKILYTFNGGTASDALGFSVSGAGDMNLDGHADLVVGAPQSAKFPGGPGYVRAFSGKDGKVLYTAPGQRNYLFGSSVRAAGDVDRDGRPDVIVGARFFHGPWPGYAEVVSGKNGRTIHTFRASEFFFAFSVGGAGDVNRDGYMDLIIGGGGAAFVRSGQNGSLLHTFKRRPGGWSDVSGAGDVNRDGYADLLLGDSSNTLDTGIAAVFSGKDGKLLRSFNGAKGGALFGRSVSEAGDVNGDGFDDIIVGANPDKFTGTPRPGSARVLSGKRLVLTSNKHFVSLSRGGTQSFSVDAGAAQGGKIGFFLGTMSGIRPGFRLGSVLVPLNLDIYTSLLLDTPNVLIVPAFVALDSAGTAQAKFMLPPGMDPKLAGLLLHHACVIMNVNPFSFDLASNPVPLMLVK